MAVEKLWIFLEALDPGSSISGLPWPSSWFTRKVVVHCISVQVGKAKFEGKKFMINWWSFSEANKQ